MRERTCLSASKISAEEASARLSAMSASMFASSGTTVAPANRMPKKAIGHAGWF